MKLLLINQYFAPDVAASGQIAADICRSLAEDYDVEVHVVTGEPSYTNEHIPAPSYELWHGVRIHRIPMGQARGRMKLSTRARGYLHFLSKASRLSDRIAREHKIDTVMTMTNPPFAAGLGRRLKRRGLRFVFVVHDIHPDVLIATNWAKLPRPLLSLWSHWAKKVLRCADDVVVLGDVMQRTIVEDKGVDPSRVRVIPLWGRPEFAPTRPDPRVRESLGYGESEKLILFAGNMGVMHPLDPILDAAKELESQAVRFLFIGEGAKKAQLIDQCQGMRLQNVSFLPYQAEERFGQILSASDACIVTLEPGLERLAVPSRAFTFLSAGKPLIALMAPEACVARIVTEHGCGWVVDGARDIADVVRRCSREEFADRGSKSRQTYEARFQREDVIRQYAELLLGASYAAVSKCSDSSEVGSVAA